MISDTTEDDAKIVTELRRALLEEGWDAKRVELSLRKLIITPTYVGPDRRNPKPKEMIHFKDKKNP